MLRHVDLCSGIGGFALGFEWASLSKPVLFCEIDAFCLEVLNKHWPHVDKATDVKELADEPAALVPDCDIITAGYPCQPFSVAGSRRGSQDDRHLWPEIRAIVKVKRPAWCVFENVYGHVGMGLDEVLSDLESDGYATRPFVVPACGVDAPHRRDRVWIVCRRLSDVGYAEHDGLPSPEVSRGTAKTGDNEPQGEDEASQFTGAGRSRYSADVAYTNVERLRGEVWSGQTGKEGESRRHASECSTWKPEPPVGRVADGVPGRMDRLKSLGNAIVPQIALKIGRTIKIEMEG